MLGESSYVFSDRRLPRDVEESGLTLGGNLVLVWGFRYRNITPIIPSNGNYNNHWRDYYRVLYG